MTAPAFEKLPALPGKSNPCPHCPPIGASLSLDSIIAVGFGDAHVSRDGDEVYREPSGNEQTRPCVACNHRGYTDPDWKVMCGTCGGTGRVDDLSLPAPIYWDVAEAEKVAVADPDHDWRITLYGPLHGEVYQRHAAGEWMLIEKNMGFA